MFRIPGSGRWSNLEFGRKFGLDRAAFALKKLRQEVVALRPDHDVNRLRALQNFLAFRLRDAARDGDLYVAAVRPRRLLDEPQLAHFRIDLLGGFFPDVAGI